LEKSEFRNRTTGGANEHERVRPESGCDPDVDRKLGLHWFELGVETLNGVTRANLNAINPAIVHYIGHVHVALAGFIAATGIAVAALSWYGVRRGEWWAWIAAVVSPVVGLIIAIPYHYMGHFEFNWVTHLGPIYLATAVFVVGASLALRAMMQRA
jgi:hypothetical protein